VVSDVLQEIECFPVGRVKSATSVADAGERAYKNVVIFSVQSEAGTSSHHQQQTSEMHLFQADSKQQVGAYML